MALQGQAFYKLSRLPVISPGYLQQNALHLGNSSEARLRPSQAMPWCFGASAFPYLFPVPRYGTFRSEKFFRILGGENAKTERIKKLTQVHQISNFKDSIR